MPRFRPNSAADTPAQPNGAPVASAEPLPDIPREAARIVRAAGVAGIDLRITGGVGVWLRSPSARTAPLARVYADIDFVGRARHRKSYSALLGGLGYQADERFNAVHGATRQYYWDPFNERQVDVFLDRVEMCHVIDLRARLTADPGDITLSLADLLVLKLQVVETNAKDFLDVIALLADHEFRGDDEGINIDYLQSLTRDDWGLWKTTTLIAGRALTFAEQLDGFAQVDRVRSQVERYLELLTAGPKSRAWRLRARIGTRKRWYQLPEEH